MDVSKISAGSHFPKIINVIIEIPAGKPNVKYEIDKESGALIVDRFLSTPMHYPAHYGFVPNTLGGDGDPIDVLVLCNFDLNPGCVIECRPIGVLLMSDEKGQDEKIIAMPSEAVAKGFGLGSITEIEHLPEITLAQIKHFFEHYKDLEKGKFVKVDGYKSAKEAMNILIISKVS